MFVRAATGEMRISRSYSRIGGSRSEAFANITSYEAPYRIVERINHLFNREELRQCYETTLGGARRATRERNNEHDDRVFATTQSVVAASSRRRWYWQFEEQRERQGRSK